MSYVIAAPTHSRLCFSRAIAMICRSPLMTKILCLPSQWSVVNLLLHATSADLQKASKGVLPKKKKKQKKNDHWAALRALDTGKKCFFFSRSLLSGHSHNRRRSTISQMAVTVCYRSAQKRWYQVSAHYYSSSSLWPTAHHASAITTTTCLTYSTRKTFDFIVQWNPPSSSYTLNCHIPVTFTG